MQGSAQDRLNHEVDQHLSEGHVMKRFLLGLLLTPFPFCTALAADGPQTLLSLTATGSVEATPTLLDASLTAQSEATDPATAQTQVNRIVANALKQASAVSQLHMAVLDYDVSERTPENHSHSWMAQQNLSLRGTDSATLLKLAGQLQSEGMILRGLNWSFTSEDKAALEKKARDDAFAKLQQQARDSAHALGLHVDHFKTVRIEFSSPIPRMAMMAARIASAPSRTNEERAVTVSLSADVYLAP